MKILYYTISSIAVYNALICTRAMYYYLISDLGSFNDPPCILLFSSCKTIASMIACKEG